MQIVFVHLNTKLPRYLKNNIERHVATFPRLQVVLIHNDKRAPALSKNVKLYKYVPDVKWFKLEKSLKHAKDFRGNFWLTSCARLFALQQYMDFTHTELVHVESDVVLAKDFPFEKFSEMQEPIGFPIISDLRGAGSVIYVRNREAGNLLISNVLSQAQLDSMTTEMLILRKLYEANKEFIRVLPIGPSLLTCYGSSVDNELPGLLHGQSYFGGCFDGVDIGQYFFGTDPRNRRGKYLIRKNIVNGYFLVENTEIRFNSSREFFDISVGEKVPSTHLYSIHLAVKKPFLFKSKNQSTNFQNWLKKESVQGIRFSLSIFLFSGFQAAKRRFSLKSSRIQ